MVACVNKGTVAYSHRVGSLMWLSLSVGYCALARLLGWQTKSPASDGRRSVGWPSRLSKVRLHFVTGKGGTGKSTVAASLALALAAGGRRVLLVEVEGRQGIAQLFDVPPLPYEEVKIATADGGGQVNALAIDIEAAFLEYLDMFYNLGIAGRAMRRIGAVEFATTIAPGLRDVLLTGKIKEIVVRAEKGRQHGLRRGRGRLPADRTHRPLPRRHPGRLRPGQGRPGALAGRGRGQAAALGPDGHSPGHPAGGAADPGDHRGDRRAARSWGCRSAA